MPFEMVYTGIRVRDLDRSIRFYCQGLGMRLRGRGSNAAIHGRWAQLESPRTHQLLELNWYSPQSPFYAPWTRGVELDHLGFRVDDLDLAVRALEAAGARRRGPPYSTAGWRMVDVEDPDGICIELGARWPAGNGGAGHRPGRARPARPEGRRRLRRHRGERGIVGRSK